MSIRDEILVFVAEHPGSSCPEIAAAFNRDQRNTRRDIAVLREMGVLVARKDERGVDRYYSNGAGAPQTIGQLNFSPPIIDVDDFREIPAAHSDSRAMVPLHGASAPADNRMRATLAGANGARAHGSRNIGAALSGGFVDTLTRLYQADGDEILNALVAAVNENTLAVRQSRAIAVRQAEGRRVALQREQQQREVAAEQARRDQFWGEFSRFREDNARRRVEDERRVQIENTPPSLAEQKHTSDEEKQAEAEENDDRLWHEALRKQARLYPPSEWPGLYSHLAADDRVFLGLIADPAEERRMRELAERADEPVDVEPEGNLDELDMPSPDDIEAAIAHARPEPPALTSPAPRPWFKKRKPDPPRSSWLTRHFSTPRRAVWR